MISLLNDGNIEGEAVIFIAFDIFILVVLGCSVGVLLMNIIEKNTSRKPTYYSIMFYIRVPCCIFMFITITLFMMFVH